MKYLLIALLFAVSTASASPQIYPSGIQYMGTGKLSVTISIYNPNSEPVNAELVVVKDLRQHPKDDISILKLIQSLSFYVLSHMKILRLSVIVL
jgi:P pilus assembly chaperone PapD